MKQIAFSLLLSVSLLSCNQKVDQEPALNTIIADTLRSIKQHISNLESEKEKSGNLPENVKQFDTCKELTNFKKPYLRSKDYSDLLSYSDSVQHWYQQVFPKGGQVAEQITFFQQQVQEKPDSINSLHLFTWILQAEEAILGIQGVYPGSGCNLYPDSEPIEVFFNQKSYKLNDTVYASFDIGIPKNIMPEYKVNLNGLQVSFQPTGQKVQHLLINTNPYILLQLKPQAKGGYQIKGNIKFEHFSGREFFKKVDSGFTIN